MSQATFELTAAKVEQVFGDCLAETERTPEKVVEIDMIVCPVLLDRAKVKEHAEVIYALLMQLPEQFCLSNGGGWSFLQACVDRTGRQWGTHQDMGRLFALGQAAGLVKCLLPRSMWVALPGGVPYYGIVDTHAGTVGPHRSVVESAEGGEANG